MGQFLQLPNQLLDLKDPLAIITYAIIDNQKTLFPFDKEVQLPLAYIAYNTMVDKYNIRKATAIESVAKLKAAGLLDYKQLPTSRNKQVFNEYSFPLISIIRTPKNGKIAGFKTLYKEVDNSVLKLDLSSKEKGILLMLYILSADTGEIIMKDTEIADKLGITVRTLNKYIKLFLDKKLLFKNRYYYSLKDHTKPTKQYTIIL